MSAIPAAPGADTRDQGRAVPFFRAGRAVFDLSLEGMVWSRRSLLMILLLGLPAPLALLFRIFITRLPPRVGGFDFYGIVIAFYYVRNALPLGALFYATALVADEVEGKTITYLLTRPIQRMSVLAGKGHADMENAPITLSYGLAGVTGGFQFPARVTPFVEGTVMGGILSGTLDRAVAVPGTTASIDDATGATGIYGRGVDIGAEFYTVGRLFLSTSIGWLRTALFT